jgi:hypothetical protein
MTTQSGGTVNRCQMPKTAMVDLGGHLEEYPCGECGACRSGGSVERWYDSQIVFALVGAVAVAVILPFHLANKAVRWIAQSGRSVL